MLGQRPDRLAGIPDAADLPSGEIGRLEGAFRRVIVLGVRAPGVIEVPWMRTDRASRRWSRTA